MAVITRFTPAQAQQNLQNDGLGSMGLTMVLLSPLWSASPNVGNYNQANLTLTLPGAWVAPFRGLREFVFNDATATLAGAITAAIGTFTVQTGQGNGFPQPGPGDIFWLELSNPTGTKRELVRCYGRAGDTFTVDRGQHGTTASDFGAGDRVRLLLPTATRTTDFSAPDGTPYTGPALVFRFHPQAVLRLEQLASIRYGSNVRPLSWAMVVQGVTGFGGVQWYEAGENLPIPGPAPLSFHDGRGLIIDPVAVAALFNDLYTAFPALQLGAGAVGNPGGLASIAGLAAGTLLHVIEPHGSAYQPAQTGADMVTVDASSNVTGTLPTNGLLPLNATDSLQGSASDTGQLRWGWATNGQLARAALQPPALPTGGAVQPPGSAAPTLGRQFFRVVAVDTVWHVLGNRTNGPVLGIGPDDQSMPTDLLPVVRDMVTINYLVDGPSVLGAAGQVLSRMNGNTGMMFAASPALDAGVGVPPAPDATGRWPIFPLPTVPMGLFPPGLPSPATGLTADWSGTNDVVVTIAATATPADTHVRIYPQRFVEIASIGPEPSFVRGDGGAAIADGINPVRVLLPNPFGLKEGELRPDPANLTLTLDIVLTPRIGNRRLTGGVGVTVGTTPPPAVPDPFAPGVDLLGLVPNNLRAISPVPLFGLPRTVTPAVNTPSSPLDLVRRLASEGSPREGPRLPSMGRLETIVVTGLPDLAPGANGTLLWDAVLSGGRWQRETLSDRHTDGNPGNPAGPDLHVAGVRVDGRLAYDLARHAIRRAQPMLGVASDRLGWVVMSDGNNFNVPLNGAATETGVGAVLETVAAVCETPELSAADPTQVPATWNGLVTQVATALGLSPPPPASINVVNSSRLYPEVRREFFIASRGQRDALWALRRAVRQARELVYIESPQFARTARPDGTPRKHEIDLVAELATRLQQQPTLRVVICLPRQPDFDPRFGGWVREALQARMEAVSDLVAVAPGRVAVFHPVGFPGRPVGIRTTSVLVDDVWCLTGTSHWRRRGMTFDGAVDVVSFDRDWRQGYSLKVRDFRRSLMASRLGVSPPPPLSADWLRLGLPRSAFDVVEDTLAQGGLGRILPLWTGPSDGAVLASTHTTADPDGADGANFLATFASLLPEEPS